MWRHGVVRAIGVRVLDTAILSLDAGFAARFLGELPPTTLNLLFGEFPGWSEVLARIETLRSNL